MNIGEECQTVLFQLPNRSIIYDALIAFHQTYRPIHTYLSIGICILASICNVCNIVILTRRPMRTPVNMILTAMACCDMIVLFSNLIFTTHFNFVAFVYCHPKHWSYGWATFLVAHAHLSLVGHSSSVWLSVMLAWIRYETLRSRGNLSGRQIDLTYSYISIGAVITLVSILNAPNFLTYKINEMQLKDACLIANTSIVSPNSPAYVPGVSDLALASHCLIFRLAFWISGSLFKLCPCMCLTLLVTLLVRILAEVKRNRTRLLLKPTIITSNNTNNIVNGNHRHSRAAESTDRTTRMLLAIVSVFLVTELPQGIMAVASGLFSEEFRMYIYNGVGDILDLLSLINSCTTFVIYCTMSAQFRLEFRRVFLPRSIAERFGTIDEHHRRRMSEPFTKMSYMRSANGDHQHDGSADRSSLLAGGDESCGSVRKQLNSNVIASASNCLLSPNYSANHLSSNGVAHWSSSSRETIDESTELLPNNSSEPIDVVANRRRRLLISVGDVETIYHCV